MKTTKDLKQEISDITHRAETEEMKPAVLTKLKKRLVYLRTCIKYLETNPSPDFLKQQIEAVENKITLRMTGFPLDLYNNQAKSVASKMKKAYEKQYDVPKLREQVRTMRFLLK